MIKHWDILKKAITISCMLLSIMQCTNEITGEDGDDSAAMKKGRGGGTSSPITTSSFVNSSFAAELAFDGDQNTRWESQAADPQWIKKDLGSGQPIQEIKLDWAASYATSYSIKISNNGKKWTTVHTQAHGDGGHDVIVLDGIYARYIQVYGMSRNTTAGYSIKEIVIDTDVPEQLECYSGSDCNDGSSCTDDICDNGTCSHVNNGSCTTSCNSSDNLIQNCDFSAGLTSWAGSVYFEATSGTQSVINGVLNLTIDNGGMNTWEIQPRQENLSLIQGVEYQLQYSAWAASNRTMEASITMNRPDWISYSGTKTDYLTNQPQVFTHTFTMNAATDTDVKLEYKLGGQGGTDVYIDDVSLIALNAPQPTCYDGIQNGNESGIDCGGSCGACQQATCWDGVQNGNETGVDCGGSCGACQQGPVEFYVDGSQSQESYNQLMNQGRTSDAQLIGQIAFTAQSRWFGDWNSPSRVYGDVDGYLDAAERAGQKGNFVLYAIPARDCGSYSGGGLPFDQYIPWIREVARAVQGREPWIVLEPDAMPMLGQCEQGDRVGLLTEAAQILKATGARVYLDIGPSNWHPTNRRIEFITMVGAHNITGFSSNVSNFIDTPTERSLNDQVASATGVKYIIDTSRNGNGSNGEWCNPRGRALGENPRVIFEGALDGYLWVKRPGESDGTCNSGPTAGHWWLEYALELARNR